MKSRVLKRKLDRQTYFLLTITARRDRHIASALSILVPTSFSLCGCSQSKSLSNLLT